jgi:hypothetical protein
VTRHGWQPTSPRWIEARPVPRRIFVVTRHDQHECRVTEIEAGVEGCATKLELITALLPLINRLVGSARSDDPGEGGADP